jgi:hypothetical protein
MFFNKFRDKFKNLPLTCSEFFCDHCPVPSIFNYKYIQYLVSGQAYRCACIVC